MAGTCSDIGSPRPAVGTSSDPAGEVPPYGRGVEREVVIRFAEPERAVANGGDRGPDEVRGTVAAAGEHSSGPLPFTGWLQLLGHLEMLSGIGPAESGD